MQILDLDLVFPKLPSVDGNVCISEMFESQKYLNLNNPYVFECDRNLRLTSNPNRNGRKIPTNVINKSFVSLGDRYKDLFNLDVLELICEKK